MTYSHDEIMDLLGAYALDAVDADEREVIEAHLLTCPRCTAEVADHREVAAMLAHTGAPAPEGLWTRIQDSLEETPPAMSWPVTRPPEVDATTAGEGAATSDGAEVVTLDGARARRRSVPRWLPAAAAAAVVLVIGLVVGGIVAGDDAQVVDRPVAAPSLEEVARRAFNDPQARTATLTTDSGDLAAQVAIERDGTGYLLATSLPSLDPQHTYQLWGIRGDVVVSLGVLGPSPGVVAFSSDPSVELLAITREVAGGVVSSQNDPVLAGEVS